jgi:hypothetical protein
LIVGADVVLDRDDLLRLGILLLPDAEVQRAVVDVGRHVHATLMLLKRQARGIPALSEETRGVVDRDAEIVAEVRSGPPVLFIFVSPIRDPVPSQKNLR